MACNKRDCKYRCDYLKETGNCNYCEITGHTKLSQLSPEDRAKYRCDKCQFYEPIETHKRSRRRTVDYDRISKLYDEKLNDAEIAQRCNCCEGTVSSWRHTYGLPQNGQKRVRKHKVDPAAYMVLYNLGLNDIEAGKILGVSYGSIGTLRRKMKLPSNGVPGPEKGSVGGRHESK